MITKDNAALYLPLIQAMAEGKKIEVQMSHNGEWAERTSLNFDGQPECYRVKVEPPPPRDIWVNVYKSGSGCEFFGHDSKEKAVTYAAQSNSSELAVHFREVRE